MGLTTAIVTPNFNGGRFLAKTMDTVISSDIDGLQYVVVDGGSTDESIAIIDSRRERLFHVFSEPDNGIYDALNKGFSVTSSDIMGWINSGDILFPDSLAIVQEVFSIYPEIEWLTSRVTTMLDHRGRIAFQAIHYGFERDGFLRGDTLPGFGTGPMMAYIQQESTFWRRSLWERTGGRLNDRLRLAADFELWARFFDVADLWSISAPLGAFRKHAGQLTEVYQSVYLAEAKCVLEARGGRPRTTVGGALRLALRRALPRSLRPAAHRIGLFHTAPILEYDFELQSWRRCSL
jgi:glycosyltransferase involved in cell wall biosynthesis